MDVKQAILRAKEYAVQFLEVDPEDILLEEIKSSTDHWLITLSYRARGTIRSRHAVGDLAMPVRDKYDYRELKAFKVNKATGEVEEMSYVQPI